MEKRESGKTITIKINGKKQNFDDSQQNPNSKQVHSKDTRDGEKGTEKLQKKDRVEFTTISEAAVTHDSIDESFDWILPETPEEPELNGYKHPPDPKIPKKKKSLKNKLIGKRKIDRRVFTTIFTAVFLAVILGTSFGLIMLKLVFIEKPAETATVQEPTIVSEQKPEQNQTGNLSLKLPIISTWLIQGGAYTNKDSAAQIVTSLKDSGLSASILENSGNSYVLMAVADTKEHAKEMATDLKHSDIDQPFPKEMSFGGNDVKGLNEQEKAYLEAIPLLVETMTIAVSTAALTDAVPQTLIDSIKQQTEKMDEGSKIANEQIKGLKDHVVGAVKNLDSLQKSTSTKEIASLQQHLLSILTAYQSLK